MTDQHSIPSILDQFDTAYSVVTTDRREVYGDPLDTYRRVAALRAVVDECSDPQIREIIGMVATKLVRLVQTPDHLDSWVDVAGYARTAAMLLDSRHSAGSRAELRDCK
ncbi:hypothetical protein FHS52_000939 [Erythromicrobium ramosum]|uniref:DUF6378 domain-containing protein n=1 Tax=Erythrobacter ramosus TaxID=35811 RepID=A0ABR6HWG0_9SPHN|nr:DUF6378 domain-containing protein [Erythrobacter ramosus]MBB3774996.1 hypothetical protein [Erythrobacter ramosus]